MEQALCSFPRLSEYVETEGLQDLTILFHNIKLGLTMKNVKIMIIYAHVFSEVLVMIYKTFITNKLSTIES